MKNTYKLALLLAAALGVNLAVADRTAWAERGGKHEAKEHREHKERGEHGGNRERHDDYDRRGEGGFHDGREAGFRPEPYFNDHHRTIIRDYYVEQYRSGSCPPGLAKKHNGCLPPGQARKWVLGRPLPRNVVYYDVPAGIIGYPPPGYRFVRVASDILMIAVGTGMVVDALTDLNPW